VHTKANSQSSSRAAFFLSFIIMLMIIKIIINMINMTHGKAGSVNGGKMVANERYLLVLYLITGNARSII